MAESNTAAIANVVWRISFRRYVKEAFSGIGPYRHGSRWSAPGVSIVYSSESLALACVEFFVHFNEEDATAPLVAISAEIPASLHAEQLEIADLPANWQQDPAPEALQQFGADWIKRNESAVLCVPSAVIPVESNYLLNPAHPDFARIQIRPPQPFGFDSRMWKRGRR